MINEERLGLNGRSASAWGGVSPAQGHHDPSRSVARRRSRSRTTATTSRCIHRRPTASELAVAIICLAGAAMIASTCGSCRRRTSRSLSRSRGAHVAFLAQDEPDTCVRPRSSSRGRRQQLGDRGRAMARCGRSPTPTPIAGAADIRASGCGCSAGRPPRLSRIRAATSAARRDRASVSRVRAAYPARPRATCGSRRGRASSRFAADAAATTGGDPTVDGATSRPVFARVCAHCHLPDGSERRRPIDRRAEWGGERGEIGKRVVVDRSMPPAGTAMSDADRAAISAWAGAGAR